MKILQYFLLLILLSAVSLVVFVLTQNPNFTVQRQFVLQAPKNIVYQYIADLNTWSNWISTKKLDQGNYILDINKLGSYEIQPEYQYPYDSLSQDILKDDKISNIKWAFKSTADSLATLVDFEFSSSLDLKTKLLTFFSGSPTKIATHELEKNTNALMVYFIKQYQEHRWDSIGIVEQPELRYIGLPTQESTYFSLDKDLNKSISSLMEFTSSNRIQVDKSPFLIVNKIQNDKISYTVGLVIQDEIFLNPDDIFFSGLINKGHYLQNDLKGYYTHLPTKLVDYKSLVKKANTNLEANKDILIFLQESVLQSPLPGSWKTSIKIPLESETLSNQTPVDSNS
ncbi:hypothetical protein [Myroides sp. LJL119]